MLWGSKCAHTSVYVCVLGMMVLFEILSCLEFDKHQNREKTENPKTMGVREEPFQCPGTSRLWANAFLSSPRTPALRHSGLAGWAGLAS